MQHADLWVDDAAHLLHFCGRCFPCDREIVTALPWKGHALLLSADTDCLSLWDGDGLVRTTRAGVYPQSMVIQGNTAYVCGGADGRLHLLSLPALLETADFNLPGMPERVCTRGNAVWMLSLLPEPEVCTALLQLDLRTGEQFEIARFTGIPGALTKDDHGLWVGVSELVLHIPYDATEADLVIEGFGLPRDIEVQTTGVLVVDELDGRSVFIRT